MNYYIPLPGDLEAMGFEYWTHMYKDYYEYKLSKNMSITYNPGHEFCLVLNGNVTPLDLHNKSELKKLIKILGRSGVYLIK